MAQLAGFNPKTVAIQIADVDAGVDIANRVVWVAPVACTVQSVTVCGKATTAINTVDYVLITLSKGGTAFATKNFTSNIAANTVYSFTLSNTAGVSVAANTPVLMDFTVAAASNTNTDELCVTMTYNQDGLV